MMYKLISALEENNFYNDGEYSMFGSDEDCSIDAFIEDFFLKNGITNVITDITDAFDSPGYSCSVLSVTWVDELGLHLETFLIEGM